MNDFEGGGDVNVIEEVQVNDVALPVTDKSVNVPVPVNSDFTLSELGEKSYNSLDDVPTEFPPEEHEHGDDKINLSNTYTSGNFEDLKTQREVNDFMNDFEGGGGHEIFSQEDETTLTQRDNLRFKGYLKATDNIPDTEVDIDEEQLDNLDIDRFLLNDEKIKIKLSTGKLLRGVGGIAEEVDLIEGLNKVPVGDGLGGYNEVDTLGIFDILTATATEDGQLIFTNIDDNSISQLPAGYVIENIVIKETERENVSISIGSILAGTDIVNEEPVNAGGEILARLGKVFFSTTLNQSLYVSSRNWGNASITIKIFIKKIWL